MSFLKSVLCLVCLGLMVTVSAQEQKTIKSPRMEASANVGEAVVTLGWGAPSVRDREIFGELVPFDKVWRTGANECSTIEISKNLMIEGEELAAGKYGLFTIPGEETWTVIFNSNADQFGHYDYDESMDVLRIEVAPKSLDESVEQMEMFVKTKDDQSWIGLKWADTKVGLKVAEAASN
ncbi:MAG: DUF2911 domain-containing protein [Saprospiraceae bacterium]|nr:DUF2911 domain-containing protein [Saprospiraceae bacterium]